MAQMMMPQKNGLKMCMEVGHSYILLLSKMSKGAEILRVIGVHMIHYHTIVAMLITMQMSISARKGEEMLISIV